MSIIYYIFSSLQVFTATFIYFSNNPIHSILLLILLFFESAVVFSLFNLEFISLLFILVYVGAIAVLFLFVVMMLRIKLKDLIVDSSFFMSPVNIASNAHLCIFYLLNHKPFIFATSAFSSNDFICFTSIEESFNEVHTLGQVFYNYYVVCILIAGLILLLALIGSIVLSLDFKKSRINSVVFRKLSRTSNFVSFIK
jgi:NADH-quinone oxidoreductase subunit J